MTLKSTRLRTVSSMILEAQGTAKKIDDAQIKIRLESILRGSSGKFWFDVTTSGMIKSGEEEKLRISGFKSNKSGAVICLIDDLLVEGLIDEEIEYSRDSAGKTIDFKVNSLDN